MGTKFAEHRIRSRNNKRLLHFKLFVERLALLIIFYTFVQKTES